tara:strand:- start:993 stop:1772 length:780 start_codon:yes stop_codon:yes gene_type:complete
LNSYKIFYIPWLCLAGFLLVLSACQTTPVPGPYEPLKILSAQVVMDRLIERKKVLTDIKSFAKASLTRKGSTQTFKQVILIKNGDTIRVDTLSFFGNPIGVFIHDPVKTLIYDPGNNKTYYGSHVWRAVEKVLGSSLDFHETIHLLAGNILDNLKLKRGSLIKDKTYYQLEAFDSKGNNRIVIKADAFKLVPTNLQKYNGPYLVYAVEWRDYRQAGDYLFAHTVALSRPDQEETLVVTYQKPKINGGLPSSAFQLVAKN